MSVRRLGMISRPDAQQRLHAGAASRIEFASYIRDKKDVARRNAERFGDALVTRRIVFRARRGIEVPSQKLGEVACRSAGEKQTLRENAAGRKDSNIDLLRVPALECRWDIFEDLSVQFAAFVAFTPDPALDGFQRG